jgi:protease I
MKKFKALIATSNYVQDQEFIYPYFRLLEEEIHVDVFILENTHVTGFMGTNIPPLKDHQLLKFETIKSDSYDLLVLPGGVKSMEKLRQYKPLLELINKFDNDGKTIACICSAVQLLISAKITKNRTISGYYSFIDDIINSGANYLDQPAVVDQNIITTAHYKDLGPWMKATLKVLYNKK